MCLSFVGWITAVRTRGTVPAGKGLMGGFFVVVLTVFVVVIAVIAN